MRRTAVCIAFASLLVVGVSGRWSAGAPPTEPTPDHLEQLQRCREGIIDPDTRPKSRRRWAAQLLSYNSSQAKALAVELLGLSDQPEVQRALCAEVADRVRQSPERLDTGLVDPLIDLLGAEDDGLRVLAAQALTNFPGADVPARLGKLASQPEAPLAKRLAAIDALAPNTHRREVIGQLVALLDAGVPEVSERAIAALESAAPEASGGNVDRWRSWWASKSQLSEEAWLAERLRVDRDRLRQVTEEFKHFQESARREQAASTAQIRGLQRELFRVLTAEQREARLAEWLSDPMPVVKLTALTIIRAQMADEGKRPEGGVLEALLQLLSRGSPAVRCEVLEIVQNLNAPIVVEAVLERVEREKDPSTRHAIFRALGKLDKPEAIPALIREIASPNSTPDCVREAAIALGRVASRSIAAEHVRAAVDALKARYQATPADEITLRAALLDAMAGVGDRAFTPECLEAIESDEAAILRPAIRGVRAVNDTSKLPRLRTLTSHPDLLVRLVAIDAVGYLGREEADLESLLTRLNPTIETDVLAKEAAWRAFIAFLSNRSVADQISVAERLRDMPELEVRYLETLAQSPSTANSDAAYLETVYDRLATVLVAQGRYGEAVEPLRTLYQMQSANSDTPAAASGLRLVEAMLRGDAETGVADLVRQLAVTADEAAKVRLIDTVAECLASPEVQADRERARSLVIELQSVPAGILGQGWTQLLEEAISQPGSIDNEETPDAPPPGP